MKLAVALLMTMLFASACTRSGQQAIAPLVERASGLEQVAPDSAMLLYDRACRAFRKGSGSTEIKAAARAHLRLGYMLIDRRQRYLDAFSHLRESSRLASSQALHDVAAEAENNTAVLYSYYDDVPNTLRHVRAAVEQALKGNHFNTAIWAYENVVVETILEAPPSQHDLAVCTKQISHIPDTLSSYALGKAAHAAAVAWMAHDWKKLLSAVRRWMKVAGPHRPDLACVAAVASLRLDDEAEAIAHLRTAYATDSWGPVRLYAARLLVDTYGNAGNTDSAFIWHRRVGELEDFIYRGQKYGTVRDMFTELEAKEHMEIVRQQKARAQMLTVWLWSAVIVCLLAAGAIIIIARQNRRLRQQAKTLFRKDTELLKPKVKTSEPKAHKEAYGQQEMEELMEQIRQVMENDEMICNPDFSISSLTSQCGKNIEKVRNAIRVCNKTNFSVMLAEARIRIASLRLRNPEYAQYTIEAIAQSVGILSRSNFAILFRRHTGLNPGEYRNLAAQELQNNGDE